MGIIIISTNGRRILKEKARHPLHAIQSAFRSRCFDLRISGLLIEFYSHHEWRRQIGQPWRYDEIGRLSYPCYLRYPHDSYWNYGLHGR